MRHKRLQHMGEGVKAKKATSSGVRVRARDKCARDKHLSAQRDHKVEGGGADDAALLSTSSVFSPLRRHSVDIDALSPTEHRHPFPSFTEQT